MKLHLLFATVVATLFTSAASAQIVTTSPAILQESSKDVVITYNAAAPQGNKGLINLPQTTEVYAHIGVITNKSNGEWSHVLTPWPESNGSNANSANTPKNHLKRVDANTYTLSIGDIRTYFGLTDPAEKVQRIAMVFRNSDGSKEGKTSSGGDIFVNVAPDEFTITLTTDAKSNVLSAAQKVTFTLSATANADLSIDVNGTSIASAQSATTVSGTYDITKRGFYKATAKAVYDGKTYTQTLTVAWPTESPAAAYPGGVPVQGAIKQADGSVIFCLAAPQKKSVILVPSWDNYDISDANMMSYFDYQGNRYFWTKVEGLDNDKYYPYYYLVDGTISVADPYAHLILDCYNDKWIDSSIWPEMPQYPYEQIDGNVMLAVYRGDIDEYDWQVKDFEIPDHKQLIVYEILLRDFTGTDGYANANGTIKAAYDKIPYLKELGINAVELMPIMEFNGNNSWGYNTNFYFAPDKAYGSPDDYRRFIDECHAQGIAVILDIVFNQSDGLHPWYQMYPSNANPFYNAVAPHAYSVLNDWNQGGNKLVEQQWCDALRYWMTAYNVDGFRFDLVKGLGDNNSYSGGTDNYNSSRIQRMKRLHAVIRSVKPNGIHINEDLAQAQEEIELGNDGMLQWANINVASGRFAAGWNSSDSKLPSSLMGGAPIAAFLSTKQDNRPWGSTVSYAESHDEQRLGFYVNTDGKDQSVKDNAYRRLGLLAVEMLLTPGPKMIWQFGELGDAQNAKNSSGNNVDPKTVVWYLLNDENARGLHDIYQTICNLRLNNPELFAESAQFTALNMDAALTSARTIRLTAGDKEILAYINASLSGATKNISCKALAGDPSSYKLLIASPDYNTTPTVTGATMTAKLNPGMFAIYVSENTTSGIEDLVVDNTSDQPAVYYNLQGVQIANPEEGIYIVRRGDKVTKEYIR